LEEEELQGPVFMVRNLAKKKKNRETSKWRGIRNEIEKQ